MWLQIVHENQRKQIFVLNFETIGVYLKSKIYSRNNIFNMMLLYIVFTSCLHEGKKNTIMIKSYVKWNKNAEKERPLEREN